MENKIDLSYNRDRIYMTTTHVYRQGDSMELKTQWSLIVDLNITDRHGLHTRRLTRELVAEFNAVLKKGRQEE